MVSEKCGTLYLALETICTDMGVEDLHVRARRPTEETPPPPRKVPRVSGSANWSAAENLGALPGFFLGGYHIFPNGVG
jgi:hypothetical protein